MRLQEDSESDGAILTIARRERDELPPTVAVRGPFTRSTGSSVHGDVLDDVAVAPSSSTESVTASVADLRRSGGDFKVGGSTVFAPTT